MVTMAMVTMFEKPVVMSMTTPVSKEQFSVESPVVVLVPLSRGDGRWWANPLGIVGGSIGCQIDGG